MDFSKEINFKLKKDNSPQQIRIQIKKSLRFGTKSEYQTTYYVDKYLKIDSSDMVIGEILIGPEEKEGKTHWDKAFNQPNNRVFMWHSFECDHS